MTDDDRTGGTVLVALDPSVDDQRRFEAAAGAHALRFVPTVDAETAGLEDAVAVLGHVPPDALAQASRLRWIHSWAAGPDAQLSDSMLASDVVLTSAAGNGAVPLAEHAIMLMLMLDRGAPRWAHAQADRRWDRYLHGELAGATLGIVGMGNAGTDLAGKARAFHMRVLGCRRNPDRPVEGVEQMFALDELHSMLPECDFVVVTAPLTRETERAFDEQAFRAMRDSAYWIVVSRGGIADDAALLRALGEGWIAGAGLDAHAVEPLPRDSPFWTAPHTIITPHNGATTLGTARRGIDIGVENLARFVEGRALVNVVGKHAGY